MIYRGVIIEESLSDKSILDQVNVLKTEIEKVTSRHKTPWVDKWTLDTVEIKEEKAEKIADLISKSIDSSHKSSWYVDFRNDKYHYIIFKDKVFKVKAGDPYKQVRDYGLSLGIPPYQLDFEDFDRDLIEENV